MNLPYPSWFNVTAFWWLQLPSASQLPTTAITSPWIDHTNHLKLRFSSCIGAILYMSPIISVCKHTWRCFTSDNKSHLGGVHSSKTNCDNQWSSERYVQLLNTYSKTKPLLQCKINPKAAQRRYVYIVYLGLQRCLTALTKSPQGSRITCVTPL